MHNVHDKNDYLISRSESPTPLEHPQTGSSPLIHGKQEKKKIEEKGEQVVLGRDFVEILLTGRILIILGSADQATARPCCVACRVPCDGMMHVCTPRVRFCLVRLVCIISDRSGSPDLVHAACSYRTTRLCVATDTRSGWSCLAVSSAATNSIIRSLGVHHNVQILKYTTWL
jgi:hypothetical protein